MDLLTKIKQSLRISHDKLDEDILADIEACKADLKLVGVTYADENEPLIYNAIKLWCKSSYTDDMTKSAEYMRRYEGLKACLMMAGGYGRPREDTR